MLSSVPTKENKKQKNYTVPLLIGFIFLLLVAISGLSGLYYFETQAEPTVVVINQTTNNTTAHPVQTVKKTSSSQVANQKKTTTTSQKESDEKSETPDKKTGNST